MYKRSFKDFFRNRKSLYMIFAIALISISTLTIVYAALSVTLNITGTADISAASWDVHLDNVNVNTQSVSGNAPTITGGTTATFSTKLEVPGDFYEFTIDVVNDGSIDAMIESIVKTPTLTTAQAKYLKYEVEYQNGESINTRQLVTKNSFVRLKVRVEFRNDITSSDLPKTAETLNLSFTVVYVQSDNNSENIVVENNGKIVKLVSGDYDTIGSEVCINEECFYVISSTDDTVTMLAKYNLYVGNSVDSDWNITPLENPTGRQDSTALGGFCYDCSTQSEIYPWIGTVAFSSEDREDEDFRNYNGSIVEEHVNNYKVIIENLGVSVDEARLITKEELTDENTFACVEMGDCTDRYPWIYSTAYWTSSPQGDNDGIAAVYAPYFNTECIGSLNGSYYYDEQYMGIRPVITISKSEF